MRRLLTLVLFALATTPFAQDWGQLATISSTMGVQDGRLCLGEASRGDIGCPAYAPYVSPNGNVGIGTSVPTSTFQIRNNIIFDEGNGNIAIGPDIRFQSAGLIAADDALHINVDATNNSNGGFSINKGSNSMTGATRLLTLANNGDLTLGYADAVTDTRLLTVKSAGYAGLVLNGDTTNVSGEPGGAYVAFGLDGNRPNGQHYIGMTNRNGENPKGVSTTGATVNSLMLGTEYTDANGNIQFAPGNAVNMTMLGANGYVGIGKPNPTSPLDVSGTVRASAFIGDGSGLTNLPSGTGDRLTSGTVAVTANNATGIVSLSTAGTTWGYLGSNASYIPNLNSNTVSATNISVTTINGNPAGGGMACRTVTATNATADCGAEEFVTGGGGTCTGTTGTFMRTSTPSGNGWVVTCSGGNRSVYAICCK